MSNAKAISSPCINVCAVSAKTGICVGCGRSLKEIGGWSRMSEAERRDIMAALPARIASLGELATAPEVALAKIDAALS